jgi:hypothetical protein
MTELVSTEGNEGNEDREQKSPFSSFAAVEPLRFSGAFPLCLFPANPSNLQLKL